MRNWHIPILFFGVLIILAGCHSKKQEAASEVHFKIPSQAKNQTHNPPATGKFRSFPGGPCEGCNIMFIGMPLKMDAVDTTQGWLQNKPKLHIEGTVYQKDQKTPAQDVIVYFYHTDPSGRYVSNENITPSARKHGYLRGWVKTGPDGRFSIYTSKPAPYPHENIEAHIHVFVKEPFLDVPYYIDEWVFEDDPLLTDAVKAKLMKRGGSGILKTRKENDVLVAKQDIVLGLNIPDYPE